MMRLTPLLAALVLAATAPAAESPIGRSGIQQVALTVSDLDRAVKFYRDRLGLRLLFVTNGMAFFDTGGTRLMISLVKNRPATPPATIVYFNVADFPAALTRLAEAKAELDGGVETVQRTAKGELRLQQFHDPDGNALAVMGTVLAP